MGLDVYVGSLTRYYCGNWETVVQRFGRQQGMPVHVVRPGGDSGERLDAKVVLEAVTLWREALNAGLADQVEHPLDWDEGPDTPYFTDKPAWDCYSDLLLWAAYEEHRGIDRPISHVENIADDPALQASRAEGFHTRYPNLLRDVEFWFPVDLDFTFEAMDLTGKKMRFGSSVGLLRELRDLDSRTWKSSPDEVQKWARENSPHGAPLESGAKYAYSLMCGLAADAIEHRLIMKLDY
jgi:hypothetical protein